MSDDTQQPIVIKRIKKGGAGAHGGAWKIAYADFVTAMMAFFLLMWLLGSTSQGDLNGIAEYFQNPLKVAMGGGSGSGDSSSLIPGGGRDLTSTHGQVKRGDIEAEKKTINLQRLKADFEKVEQTRLESLKGELEALINSSPALSQFRNQLLLDLTTEGLRIQIVDEKNRPMFDSASSDVKPYTRVILREIGLALNKVENRISLSGHTDAQPYAGGDRGFGNWELSTNRANASRREMVAGGMDDAKIMRVVGLASTVLYDKQEPYSPNNRRISIIVMNKRTEEAILADGRQMDGEDAPGVDAKGIIAAPAAAAGR
ncbi:MAG: flagellar motor protein MotB [Rhodocyclales bacterium RIFCSPLOWO2_02_FULL_63_24]|nr:MAG: flagellar motor protein MotB [Rhodocyclales bacterium GWA2_65_20]OHC69357.1 MAG: flagellar motor protein MotB [Rhodocyclales bacterium RIFCSPLOWO2_02_FULL_63_24]